VLVVADRDETLLDTDIVYRLASPTAIADTSWIKPGKVAWDWWNFNNIYGVPFRAGVNTDTYKHYIDFAAENGIEYVILDEGWYKLGDLMTQMPGIDMEFIGTDPATIKVRGIDAALTGFTVDGNNFANAASSGANRKFELEAMAVQNVEKIEVTKAPTPAQDGTAIGGSVNLVSRGPFGQRGRRISLVASLTDRELEVFQLLGKGLKVREIADKLYLSTKTIESHREHIKQKLSLPSSSALLRYAIHALQEA
jgi:DNA-binding CsgD family transcriptional regulator